MGMPWLTFTMLSVMSVAVASSMPLERRLQRCREEEAAAEKGNSKSDPKIGPQSCRGKTCKMCTEMENCTCAQKLKLSYNAHAKKNSQKNVTRYFCLYSYFYLHLQFGCAKSQLCTSFGMKSKIAKNCEKHKGFEKAHAKKHPKTLKNEQTWTI